MAQITLPTGKSHLSFSELSDWMACSFRHKLKQVLKIDLSKPSENLVFGSAMHAVIEHYVTNKVIDESIAKKIIDEECTKQNLLIENAEKQRAALLKTVMKMVNDIPQFLDNTFPGWELVEAEENLMESIAALFPNHEGLFFKGFIDCVLTVPGKKGEKIYWILDWKSAGRPWNKEKLMDVKTTYQLVLYKKFWSLKHNVPMKSIKCGFVTLLKTAKSGKVCKLIPISVGDVTAGKSLTVLNNAFASIKRGTAIKNRESCKYCDYYNTEHCK
jgi:hypothetical protein